MGLFSKKELIPVKLGKVIFKDAIMCAESFNDNIRSRTTKKHTTQSL